MNFHRVAVPALALILSVPLLAVKAVASPQYDRDRDWDAPPQELNEFQRQGFHDGIEGARRDYDNHRRPDVENRDEYRHPNLPPEERQAYRDGFRRGYNMAISHLMGSEPPASYRPPVIVQWDAPPSEFNDVQRRGFRDGIEGARKDVENHRSPDVENRDEYRHPDVPRELRQAYRDGFRQGYDAGMSHLMAGPAPEFRGDWDTVPREFDEVRQRGFHDGIEGARRDFENHRRPDEENRDEYRHPNVAPELREEYREGFRRGYDRAMAHLMGQPSRY